MTSTETYRIQSLASGRCLPQEYATKEDAIHAHRSQFGAARQGAYRVVSPSDDLSLPEWAK